MQTEQNFDLCRKKASPSPCDGGAAKANLEFTKDSHSLDEA